MAVLRNPRHEKFSQGIAKGLSGRQAYVKAGYSANGADASASKLLKSPKVSARIAELKNAVVSGVVKLMITEKNTRLADYQDMRDRILALMAARAEQYADVKGGSTGLLVRQIKSVGSGSSRQTVAEFVADSSLVRLWMDADKQAAIEVGEWSEKRELTGANGGPIQTQAIAADLSKCSAKQLEVIEEMYDEQVAARLVESANVKA